MTKPKKKFTITLIFFLLIVVLLSMVIILFDLLNFSEDDKSQQIKESELVVIQNEEPTNTQTEKHVQDFETYQEKENQQNVIEKEGDPMESLYKFLMDADNDIHNYIVEYTYMNESLDERKYIRLMDNSYFFDVTRKICIKELFENTSYSRGTKFWIVLTNDENEKITIAGTGNVLFVSTKGVQNKISCENGSFELLKNVIIDNS